MRVLLTTDTIGGVWTYTKELTEGLLHSSHSVSLVSFGRLPSPDQDAWCSAMSVRYSDTFQFAASETPLEWMAENDSAYSGAEDLLLDLVNRFGPDILHSNQFCFGKLPVAMPRLVVAHSDVLSWAAACRPNGMEPSPWLDEYKILVRTGLLSATAVVAPTHWMLQALADRFTLPREAYVIANGRDIPPPSKEMGRKLQAVSVGRLWDQAKGISLLADVQSPFPLFVAGEMGHGTERSPESFGEAILLGRLDDQHLLDLFRSSAIYLALSVYEPFGLAPLEAALCGCAVLANDIPSLREVWGDDALYFQDAHTLTSLLQTLTSDPNLLLEMQRRAFRCARLMTRTRMTELYLELYSYLIGPDEPFQPAQATHEARSHVS